LDLTSLSLLGRLQEKSHHDDWSRFVAIYKPFIERFIRLDMTLAADAEDISQEVLAKVVQHLPSFRRQRDGSFRAWLKTLTANQVALFWRRRQSRQKIGKSGAQSLVEDLPDPNSELSKAWDREYNHYLLCRLQAIIRADFTETTWRAFTLRVLEERTTAEVAAELGLSKNAVDIAKSRVLNRLRQEAAGLLEAMFLPGITGPYNSSN
jgi:RNA polymerase sigma-70 factor, ECF subfamily